MAPPKKRRKKKGVRIGGIRGVSAGDAAVPGEFDYQPDKVKKNQGGNFCSTLFPGGFDPYVEIKHYPSQVKYETKPVYNAKRACEWGEEENNVMQWSFERSQIKESVLSCVLWDYEFAEDIQIGACLIQLDDVVKKIGDKKKEEFSLKRKTGGVYTGTLTMEVSLEQEASENVTLTIKVLRGDHMKKERETDVATDTSTMMWVCFGFVSYLCIIGVVFSLLEKHMESTDDLCMSSVTHRSIETGLATQWKCECCSNSPVIVSWFDGFWFAFVTATTVGYGDYYPLTMAGRYVNGIIITVDVLFMGYCIGLIVDFIAAAAERANEKRQKNAGLKSEDENVADFIKAKSEADVLEIFTEEELEKKKQDMEEEMDDQKTAGDEIARNAQMFYWDLIIYSCLEISLIFGGSVFFYYDQIAWDSPWTYSQALHFCFVTTSTVGYGDIAPTSPGAKVFCLFYNLLSIGFLVKLGGLACDKMAEGQQKKIAQKKADESLMHWEQIAEFDVEGDGELDLYEFTRAMLKATGKCTQYDLDTIDTRFDHIDKDGSGYITKEDFAVIQKEKAEAEQRLKMQDNELLRSGNSMTDVEPTPEPGSGCIIC